MLRTEKTRALYRPDTIKVLFVGESPPPGGKTFFYDANSRLYAHWKATFERALHLQFRTDGAFLTWFKGQGFFLDDLLLTPKPQGCKGTALRKLCQTGIRHLADRNARCRPAMVVAVIKEPASGCIADAIELYAGLCRPRQGAGGIQGAWCGDDIAKAGRGRPTPSRLGIARILLSWIRQED